MNFDSLFVATKKKVGLMEKSNKTMHIFVISFTSAAF